MTATRTATTATTATTSPDHSPAHPRLRGQAWLYAIGGSIGFIAAFALTLEKIAKLRDPRYVPTCSLNPVISCGSVMDSPQASAFGFPNPLLGIAAFTVVITFGVALLCGFTPPRWIWLGMQAATTFGVVFVHWLIHSSLYSLSALCPYCIMVWVVTIPIFWYTTLHNLIHGHLSGGRPMLTRVASYHSLVLVLWYVAIIALVLQAFWSYWNSLI